MNPYSIPPFISAILFFSLGLFVLFKRNNKTTNIFPFALICLTTVWWQGTWTVLFNVQNREMIDFLIKFGYSGIIFIPFTFYHFIINWTGLKRERLIVKVLYAIGGVFLVLLWFTDYFISGSYNYYWGYYPRAGILHPLYLVFLVAATMRIFLILWFNLKSKKLSAMQTNQQKYMLALIIIYSFAAADFLVNYGIGIYPFGFVFVITCMLLMAYSTVRYRLMDIKIVFKKGMVYSLSAGILTSLFVVLVLAMTRILANMAGISSFSITVVAALTIAVLFNPLRNRIQDFVDKLFYKKSYDYYSTVQRVSSTLTAMFDKQKISEFIGRTIYDVIGLESVCLLSSVSGSNFEVTFYRHNNAVKGRGDKIESLPRILPLFGIFDHCHNSKDIVIKDELSGYHAKGNVAIFNRVREELDMLQGEAVVPVFVDGKLQQLIVTGGKLSGDVFSHEDINLLITIAEQTTIALKNAQLYSDKVQSERLASIGMMSATFAHEIRNPLTSLKTFAQLMPEKYNDLEFRETFSKIVEGEIAKIDGLIGDLLDFSVQKQSARINHFDLIELVDSTLDYVNGKIDFDLKNIQVRKAYSEPEIDMTGDSMKLTQAFENIITNACQAMGGEGRLQILINGNRGHVQVRVKDNGEGIPEDDISRIFDPFVTSKEMGVGIGLAISKRIIEDHDGQIDVESVESEGTTFTITLPVKN